jgi:predicted GIY-YIG superfamily endonuclease
MTYYVYHIAKDGSGLDEGYIGISVDPRERWSRHKSKNSDSNPVLKRAIKKYNPAFRIIASFDTLEEALWQEFTLRPFDRMGWNLSKGGGVPPSMGGWNKGQNTPKSVKEKQSQARVGRFGGHKHPRSKAANIYNKGGGLVEANVVLAEWAKKNGYHQGHLAATAREPGKVHKGIYARYAEDVECASSKRTPG